jgi:AraC-like DNA-binding protein
MGRGLSASVTPPTEGAGHFGAVKAESPPQRRMESARRKNAADADRRRYYRIIDLYLAECYAKHSVVRISELAERLGGNRQHVSRVVLRLFGQRLRDLLRERQFVYAVQLLKSSILSAREVGESAGFGHSSTFIRAFKARFGVTPTVFRRKSSKLLVYNSKVRPDHVRQS